MILLRVAALALLTPLVLAAQSAATPAGSPATRAPVAKASRITTAPVVDGKLDDGAWRDAAVISGFVQNEPFDGQPVTERTEVRITFDAQAVYVGAWLYDREPAGMIVGEVRRDIGLDNMDAFLIVFDTYLDRQNAFVFGTTPAGLEYDGQITKEGEGGFTGNLRQQSGSGGGLNLNWDGSWDVATSVDDQGWYAEFRIPFSTLRFGSGTAWGLNLARFIRRRNEQAFWAPIPRQYDLYRVSQAGTLDGIAPPWRRTLAMTPYMLGTVHRDYVAGTDTDLAGDAGGDAKIGLTPSLALDLTYNTDFAQVEVDEQQINLTRFSLFFPEKRPFFLENAGTFSVGTPQAVELVFSRRIGLDAGQSVPIRGGARLSGKAGGFTIGFMDVQTAQVDTTVAETNYGAARVIRELPNRSRIGATFASRVDTDRPADRNFTYGVDGRLGVGNAITFDAYAARTNTPGRTGRQHAVSVSGALATRSWQLGGVFREVAEDFNPEVGFLDRPASRFVSARLLRHVRTPGLPWFRELRPHISYREFFDLDGFSQTRLLHFDSHFEFANGAFFQLPALNLTREGLRAPFEISPGIIIPPGTYDNLEWGFEYNTNRSAQLALEGRIEIGGFYSGHRKGTSGTLTARAADLTAALRFSYSDVDLAEGSFTAVLTALRLAYAFTPRLYLQSLVQYNNQSDQASGNVRFGWLNTAGTGLFIVWNDVHAVGTGSRPVDRVFAIKYTYQFNLTP